MVKVTLLTALLRKWLPAYPLAVVIPGAFMVTFAQRDSDSTSVGLNAEVPQRTEVWPTEEHQGWPVLLSGGEPVDARSGRLKDLSQRAASWRGDVVRCRCARDTG